jgi:molecular chaperone GrpE
MSTDDKDFSLSLDDDVLAAALASVDKHLGGTRKRRAFDLLDDPEKEAARTQAELAVHGVAATGAALLDEDEEVEVELDVELDFDEDTAPTPAPAQHEPEPVDDEPLVNEEALRLLERNEELEALTTRQKAEIEMLRNAAARQQSDLKEQKERAVRLNIRGKRLHSNYESIKLKHDDAKAKIELWEKQMAELRDAVRTNERDRAARVARHQRETEEARINTKEKTLRELLPVLDNLELAMAHAGETPAEQMLDGVRMILRQLGGSFDRIGLQRVDSAVGAGFDPTCHEAIKHVPTDDAEPNTILTTHQVGWRLHDRLLRAARVEVAAARLDETPVSPTQEADTAAGADSAEE